MSKRIPDPVVCGPKWFNFKSREFSNEYTEGSVRVPRIRIVCPKTGEVLFHGIMGTEEERFDYQDDEDGLPTIALLRAPHPPNVQIKPPHPAILLRPLARTGDITGFLNHYYHKYNATVQCRNDVVSLSYHIVSKERHETTLNVRDHHLYTRHQEYLDVCGLSDIQGNITISNLGWNGHVLDLGYLDVSNGHVRHIPCFGGVTIVNGIINVPILFYHCDQRRMYFLKGMTSIQNKSFTVATKHIQGFWPHYDYKHPVQEDIVMEEEVRCEWSKRVQAIVSNMSMTLSKEQLGWVSNIILATVVRHPSKTVDWFGYRVHMEKPKACVKICAQTGRGKTTAIAMAVATLVKHGHMPPIFIAPSHVVREVQNLVAKALGEVDFNFTKERRAHLGVPSLVIIDDHYPGKSTGCLLGTIRSDTTFKMGKDGLGLALALANCRAFVIAGTPKGLKSLNKIWYAVATAALASSGGSGTSVGSLMEIDWRQRFKDFTPPYEVRCPLLDVECGESLTEPDAVCHIKSVLLGGKARSKSAVVAGSDIATALGMWRQHSMRTMTDTVVTDASLSQHTVNNEAYAEQAIKTVEEIQNGDAKFECPICRDEIEDTFRVHNCLHIFCLDCARRYSHTGKCAMCRKDVVWSRDGCVGGDVQNKGPISDNINACLDAIRWAKENAGGQGVIVVSESDVISKHLCNKADLDDCNAFPLETIRGANLQRKYAGIVFVTGSVLTKDDLDQVKGRVMRSGQVSDNVAVAYCHLQQPTEFSFE